MLSRLNIRELHRFGRWQGVPLAVALLATMMVVRAIDPGPLESLRLRLFDQFQEFSPRAYEPTGITIVDIDEESLSQYGQWPWPRSYIAALVDEITAAGALVIGFDILFPEADRLSPARILDNYTPSGGGDDEVDQLIRDAIELLPSYDTRLAESFARGNVVLAMGALAKHKGGVEVPDFTRTPYGIRGDPDAADALPAFERVIHTLDEIAKAARGHGVISFPPERDGVVRRAPLAVKIGDHVLPSLSVELMRILTGNPGFVVVGDAGKVVGVGMRGQFVPTGPDGRIWLHFAEHQPERYVSAARVLDRTVDKERLANKIVLVASTGLGIVDFIATPVEARMPGVEVHAQILESVIREQTLVRPPYLLWVELGMFLLAGVVVMGLVPPIRPVWTPLPYAGLFVLLLGASWVAFDHFGVLLDASFVVICTGVLYSVMLTTTRAAIERARRRLERELEVERDAAARIEGEMTAARNIQMGILPRDFPAFPERHEFSVYAMIEPMRAVGGDLYDFGLVDDNHLYFMVGDVSGKGVPASLFMAITKALFRTNALRRPDSIDRITSRANAEISRENPEMLFVTMAAGMLDISEGTLDLCNAGHDPPLLMRQGAPIEKLESEGGPPLCVLDDYEYPTDRLQLQSGDTIVIITDGVTEAMNAAQELYGMERVIEVLERMPDDADPEQITQTLYADIGQFVGDAEPTDDTTIMVVRYLGTSGSAS